MAAVEEAEEDREDFSFPTTTDTPPRFIESPPLWRPNRFSISSSPAKTPERIIHHEHHHHQASRKATNSMLQRKSFSYVERGRKTRRVGVSDGENEDEDEEEEDEKMDMLWEDFNEEFSARNLKATTMVDSDHISRGKMPNFGCVQALKLSKANKKPSIVVFMKVLKKMFLSQNSHHHPVKKNHQW